MSINKIADCTLCDRTNVLITKPSKGWCLYCNPKSNPYKPKKRKKTGELDLFKEIWEETPLAMRKCVNCSKPIKNFAPIHFDHIHTKGARPDLRLDKENIRLLCVPCHLKRHTQGID